MILFIAKLLLDLHTNFKKMNNAIYNFREPKNEPVLSYEPGSIERRLLEEELSSQKNKVIDIPLIIGGKEIRTGKTGKTVANRLSVLRGMYGEDRIPLRKTPTRKELG